MYQPGGDLHKVLLQTWYYEDLVEL